MSFYLLSEGLTYATQPPAVSASAAPSLHLTPVSVCLARCVSLFSGVYESLKLLARAEKGVDTNALAGILEFW